MSTPLMLVVWVRTLFYTACILTNAQLNRPGEGRVSGDEMRMMF